MMRSIVASMLLVAALGYTGVAQALTLCATTSAELQLALDIAEVNEDADDIRIATGSYEAPSGGFVYDAESIDGDQQDITISGGWSAFFGNPCGQVLREDPLLTFLYSEGEDRVRSLRVRSSTNVDVRLLTFFGGFTPGTGGGLLVWNLDHQGSVVIERNAFVGNTAGTGGGLYTSGGIGGLLVINNVFQGNLATSNTGAAYLRRNNGQGIMAINNTVLDNATDDTSGLATGGLRITHPDGLILVVNNNLWGNDGADLWITGDSEFALGYNNLASRIGQDPDTEEGNISVVPEYQPGLLNFTPVRGSPLVDTGNLPSDGPPPFMPDLDLKGEARIVGPSVDIGAYENERIFAHGFEVPGLF